MTGRLFAKLNLESFEDFENRIDENNGFRYRIQLCSRQHGPDRHASLRETKPLTVQLLQLKYIYITTEDSCGQEN